MSFSLLFLSFDFCFSSMWNIEIISNDVESVRRMIQPNIALVPLRSFWKIGDSSKWFVGEITIIGSWHDTDSHTATIGYSSGIQCVWALLSPWKHRSVRSICWPSDSCYTYYCSHQLHRLQQIPSTSDTLFVEKLKLYKIYFLRLPLQ